MDKQSGCAGIRHYVMWLQFCPRSRLSKSDSLEAFDNTIDEYRRYALHYPDYHAAYEGLDPRTLRRDKQTVRQVLLLWKDYDARRMQRDEDVEEALTAEFMARLKNL